MFHAFMEAVTHFIAFRTMTIGVVLALALYSFSAYKELRAWHALADEYYVEKEPDDNKWRRSEVGYVDLKHLDQVLREQHGTIAGQQWDLLHCTPYPPRAPR